MREEIFDAIRTGDRDRAERILDEDPKSASQRDTQGISALLTALYHRQNEIASSILDRDPELDIFDAAAAGKLDEVRRLLDQDRSLVTAYSPDGWTALHLAAFFGHPAVVDLLIDRGAGIDMLSTNMGNTPLQAATANGQTGVVKRLIERGADIDYATAQGRYTALHGAANGGHRDIAELLIEAGADPSATTDDGRTARELAAGRNYEEIVALIDEQSDQDRIE